jgi:hypothetical protein
MRGSLSVRRFPAPLEAQFRAARVEALAQINVTTFWLVAAMVMMFSWWDWFVDRPTGTARSRSAWPDRP